MVSFQRTTLIVFFILGQLLIRAQPNSCLQKIELIQIQASELTDVTSIMRSKNWTFDGAKEWAKTSEQSLKVINQVVSWKSSLGTEMFYYYYNGERPNFAIAILSEPCYNSILSLFSKEQKGLTSIQNGMLLTTFSVGRVNVEFLEGAKKKEYQIRLYSIDDKEIFMGFFDNPQSAEEGRLTGDWFLEGRRLISTPPIQGTAPDEGTVTVDIWVDANGNVTKAIANPAKSNTTSGALFKMAEDAARKAKFNSSAAGNEQKGSIKITFKLH